LLHYRVKSRFTFNNISELFLQNASIPANKIYTLFCSFLQENKEIVQIQVLTVRNVNDDVHIGIDVTSPLSLTDQTKLVNYLLATYTNGKIWGIWQNVYPKSISILYGEPYIMDYIDIPHASDALQKYLIPVGVGSFTTLNRDTMSATYDWIQKKILFKNVVIIGRDIIKSAYWFAHNNHCVTALSESLENYEDAVLSTKFNHLMTCFPRFLKYDSARSYSPYEECCLVFNGRDFTKNAQTWLDEHITYVKRVIVVTCKEKRIPQMKGWTISDIEFIDQQPGTDIIQQMTVFHL
jgi:hypothetical protein